MPTPRIPVSACTTLTGDPTLGASSAASRSARGWNPSGSCGISPATTGSPCPCGLALPRRRCLASSRSDRSTSCPRVAGSVKVCVTSSLSCTRRWNAFHRRHIGPTGRVIAQFGGMRDKHPPGRIAARTVSAGHVSHTPATPQPAPFSQPGLPASPACASGLCYRQTPDGNTSWSYGASTEAPATPMRANTANRRLTDRSPRRGQDRQHPSEAVFIARRTLVS